MFPSYKINGGGLDIKGYICSSTLLWMPDSTALNKFDYKVNRNQLTNSIGIHRTTADYRNLVFVYLRSHQQLCLPW